MRQLNPANEEAVGSELSIYTIYLIIHKTQAAPSLLSPRSKSHECL